MPKYRIFYLKKVLKKPRSELFYPIPERCRRCDNARPFFVSPSLMYISIPPAAQAERGLSVGGGKTPEPVVIDKFD